MKTLFLSLLLFISVNAQSDLLLLFDDGADSTLAPTNILAVGSIAKVTLSWTNAETYDSVKIYRGTSTNPTTLVYTLAGATTSKIDSALTYGVIYYYRIKGKVGSSLSSYSSNASDTVDYSTNAANLFARFSAEPTNTYKLVMAELIDTLTRFNLWDKFSCFYIGMGHNEADSKLNIISSSYTLLESGTVDWTEYAGFTGGAAGEFLNTQFVASTDSSDFKIYNASWGYYVSESPNVYGSYMEMGVIKAVSPYMNNGGFTRQTATNGRWYIREVNFSSANTADTGFYSMTKTGNVNHLILNANILSTTQAGASGVPDVPFYICAARHATASYYNSPRTIGAAWVGAYFTDTEIRIIRNAIIRFHIKVQGIDLLASVNDNLIFRDGDDLYIASKYNSTKDLVIQFGRTNQNELITFINTVLNNNSNTNISTSIYNTDDVVNGGYWGDNIGPVNILGQGWTGGAHGYEGRYSVLTSNYTAGQTTMSVDSTAIFCSVGGKARTSSGNVFTYTGKTANSLTGVSSLYSVNSGDSVEFYPATGYTTEISYKVNGIEIPNGTFFFADSVNITVRSTMFDMNTFDLTTGLSDTIYFEDVNYVIDNGNIKVDLTITPVKEMAVYTYYGMQLTSDDFQNTIYFASDSTTNEWALPSILPRSGNHATYPTYRTVLSNTAKTTNLSMYVDNTGLSLDRSLGSSTAMWFSPNGKIYNNFVNVTPKTFYIDSAYQWTGYYTWFDNNRLTENNFDHAYTVKTNGGIYLFMDSHCACADSIDITGFTSYETIENTGITFGEITNNKLPVSSDAYARAKLRMIE